MTKQYEAGLAIQVLPGVGGQEVIRIVDKVIEYIKGTGVSAYVGPFETTVEGSFEQVWDIAKECQLICIREGAPSVATYIKLFYNPVQGVLSTNEKIAKHHG